MRKRVQQLKKRENHIFGFRKKRKKRKNVRTVSETTKSPWSL